MIVTLTGSNAFALKTELKQLIEAFVAAHGELALERFDGEELSFERLRDAVQSLPFLATRKLVVVREAAGNKMLVEKFADIIDATGETTDLVIVEPRLDKRSAYYKLLKKVTDYRELNELDEHALARWLVAAAKARGGTLASPEAGLLVDRLGTNQMMLAQELDKLLAFQPHITRDSIHMLTEPIPQSTVFELLDAAFQGKAARALELYQDQRRQKVEPQQILAMLAWQLHIVTVVKTAGQRSADEVAKAARLNPFVVRKTQNLARQVTLAQLRALVARLLDIDKRLKSEALDADEAVSFVLLSMAA